jgi:hypothetical protein
LKVRLERPIGGALGKGAVVSEGGCLPTVVALSHLTNPFLAPQLSFYWDEVAALAIIPKYLSFVESTAFYHTTQPSSRHDVKIEAGNESPDFGSLSGGSLILTN